MALDNATWKEWTFLLRVETLNNLYGTFAEVIKQHLKIFSLLSNWPLEKCYKV